MTDVTRGKSSVKPNGTVRKGRLKTLSIRSRKTEPRSGPTEKLFGSRLQEIKPSGKPGGRMSSWRDSVLKLRQLHLQQPVQEAVSGRGRVIGK